MNKCVDCKNWKGKHPIDKPTDEYRMCVKLSLCDPEEGVTAEFDHEDAEYFEVGFSTGKDFGCIHFKQN